MNVENLMLGNYVIVGNEVAFVTEIGFSWVKVQTYSDYKKIVCTEEDLTPIKISREWLRKLGFWKYYKTIFRKGNHEFYVNQNKMRVGHELLPNKSERAYLGTSTRQTLFDVEYVHQLQNLVRVLANEELTIGGGE